MGLIDKSYILSEIEKRYEYWREKEFNSHSIESEIRMSECQHLMLLLNNIEMKEVDLNKEIEEQITKYYNDCEQKLKEMDDNDNDFSFMTLDNFARYFFELGLKAHKGK